MAITVDRDKCIGCEACVAAVGAIAMVEGKAEINQDTCISCGACVSECPVEAISSEVTKVICSKVPKTIKISGFI